MVPRSMQVGTPVSQSADGDLLLSIKMKPTMKMTREPEVPTRIENLAFILIDVM